MNNAVTGVVMGLTAMMLAGGARVQPAAGHGDLVRLDRHLLSPPVVSIYPALVRAAQSPAGEPVDGLADLMVQLKSIFRKEGIPGQLVWIAEIESALDARARSRAGAAGLFQLMPVTARRFGLTTGVHDERQDPLKSAQAAARYLRSLYQRFGSWPLAVAAYNAGEGRIAKVLRFRGASTLEDIMLHVPAQTRDYVQRVGNLTADREGLELAQLPPPHTAWGQYSPSR